MLQKEETDGDRLNDSRSFLTQPILFGIHRAFRSIIPVVRQPLCGNKIV